MSTGLPGVGDATLDEVWALLDYFGPCSTEAMLEKVARLRGEQIIVLEVELPEGAPTGSWYQQRIQDHPGLPWRIVNYIVLAAGLGPLLRETTFRHELVHLACGDRPVEQPQRDDVLELVRGQMSGSGPVELVRCRSTCAHPAEAERELRSEVYAYLAARPSASDFYKLARSLDPRR
jgi:hypothetical protein